jgi:glycosyltransferase involved in cell wall biosynthesis
MSEGTQNNSDLISIVIPCFNDAQFIEQAIDSAQNQSYANKEIIVVDDGSNSETKRVLKKLQSKITKLITQENKGQSTARNVGINQAKGDYILVLDSDDYFDSTYCKKAMNVFLNNKEVKIVTSLVNRIVDNKIIDLFKPSGGDIKKFILNNEATGSCMFLKADFLKVDGYDESMTQGFEDWEFYIRLLKSGGEAYIIQEPLFYYRLRSDSTTSRANKMKYDLLKFIYLKHKDLYKENFEVFISHLLNRIEREEKEKIKNTERIDFKIGKLILQPYRLIKSLLR